MSKARSVGRMRHVVTIFDPVRESDGGLGFKRSNHPVAKVFCRVEPAGGREVFAYQHLEERVTHKVTIRYNKQIRQGQFVLWRANSETDVELYIEAVTSPDERNEFMHLICRQGGNT